MAKVNTGPSRAASRDFGKAIGKSSDMSQRKQANAAAIPPSKHSPSYGGADYHAEQQQSLPKPGENG